MSSGLLRLSRFSKLVRPFWNGCSNSSRMKSKDNPKLAFVVALALVDDRNIIENGTKRNTIIRGLLGKLQVRHLIFKIPHTKRDISIIEKALDIENETHRKAFRAYVPSKDRYPKRHLGFHIPFFIYELGPVDVYDTGRFEKGHQVWVKKPTKATQRQMKKLVQQLTKKAQERQLFNRTLKMARAAYALEERTKKVKSKKFMKDRVFGRNFVVTPESWDGSAANLFTDQGKLAVEIANLRNDSRDSVATEMKSLLDDQILSCQVSCTLKYDGGESITFHASEQIRDWVNVGFESERDELMSVVPSQLMGFFKVIDNDPYDCSIYALVKCLDMRKMKLHKLLQFQESVLVDEIFIIPRESIISASIVLENPNKPGYWFVLPNDNEFPNYLGVGEASEVFDSIEICDLNTSSTINELNDCDGIVEKYDDLDVSVWSDISEGSGSVSSEEEETSGAESDGSTP